MKRWGTGNEGRKGKEKGKLRKRKKKKEKEKKRKKKRQKEKTKMVHDRRKNEPLNTGAIFNSTTTQTLPLK